MWSSFMKEFTDTPCQIGTTIPESFFITFSNKKERNSAKTTFLESFFIRRKSVESSKNKNACFLNLSMVCVPD